jgi:hypothetical protein
MRQANEIGDNMDRNEAIRKLHSIIQTWAGEFAIGDNEFDDMVAEGVQALKAIGVKKRELKKL